MQFSRVSRRKNRIFLSCRPFLARVVCESLSKCPNLKKTRLPVKISWLRACEIIRVFTMIGKKSVRASAVFDSVFRISPFLLMLIESLMYDLYESDCFIILQNVLLSVIYFTLKFLQQVFVKEIGSNFFADYIINSITFRPIFQKVITKS